MDVVQLDQPMIYDYQELIEVTGGKLCLWNTVDIQWSVKDDVSLKDIEQEVKHMVDVLSPNDVHGGFIARHYPSPGDIDLSEEKQQGIYAAFMANGCALS